MTRLVILGMINLSIFVLSQNSNAEKNTYKLPELLKRVEAKYKESKTLTAKFNQLNQSSTLGVTKENKGDLWVKRPNLLRWQTYEPDANLLVSNGKKFWFYTPPFDEEEPGQVIIKKSSEAHSKLANALMSGSFSLVKDVKLKAKGENHFIIIPKKGTAGDLTQAEVFIEKGTLYIYKIILKHKGGNRSTILLSSIQLGKVIKDSLFNFDPPSGTEVFEE